MMKMRAKSICLEHNSFNYIKQQKILYLLIGILFVGGVICGSFCVNSLGVAQKEGLATYLSNFFQGLDEGGIVDPQTSLKYSIGEHLKIMGLIWLLGLSMIGIPLILGFIFLKGMFLGFNIGFLFSQFSWQGFWFAFVSLVPQNLLIIPIYIIIAVAGINFATSLVVNRLIYHRGEIYPRFLTFSFLAIGGVPVLILVSIFQAYISPILMKCTLPIT